jgi:predicted Rossmann fold flavoprotein
LGRKLLATGNGRCNLTNINCPGAENTLGFFDSLGLLTRTETEGRVYPYSGQAASVCDALTDELARLGVEDVCQREERAVERAATGAGAGFQVVTEDGRFFSDAVILATGGRAGPQFGATGDGYRFAKALGHTVVSVRPSLVQLVCGEPFLQSLKGLRVKGRVLLLRESAGGIVDSEDGEIQFTGDGLSGICVFNLSKSYVRGDVVSIDLFPGYGGDALRALLTGRAETLRDRSASEFLTGMLPQKLIPVLSSLLSLKEGRRAASLSSGEVWAAARLLKDWRIGITGVKGWKEAQVTAGGVDLAEINRDAMESRLVPGLYFAGELLNVDGKCGGFNLQWAWVSGLAAGRSAAGAVKRC